MFFKNVDGCYSYLETEINVKECIKNIPKSIYLLIN